jgi:thioredoxin 1
MATVTLTGADFGDTVTKPGITFVDFWAEWCGPCRMFGPIFEQASEQHPEITFAKVDTEVERELAGAAGITSIPTLMAFRDGVLVFNQAGALPAPAFQELIDAVNALDMRAVAEAIENQSRSASAD